MCGPPSGGACCGRRDFVDHLREIGPPCRCFESSLVGAMPSHGAMIWPDVYARHTCSSRTPKTNSFLPERGRYKRIQSPESIDGCVFFQLHLDFSTTRSAYGKSRGV